jgi:hypothetical protein
MSDQSSTQALGHTTVVLRWVERPRVEEFLHASDGFQVLLAFTLAAAGASLSCSIVIAAGVLHPIGMYLFLCGLIVGTLVLGALVMREFRRVQRVRKGLDSATVEVPVPLSLVTPGAAPTFSVANTTSAGAVAQVDAQPHGPVPIQTSQENP